MNLQQPYLLAQAVEFTNVEELTQDTKERFNHNETDVVITHRYSRKRSKVISQSAANLLKQFCTPVSWPNAVLQYALQNGENPDQVAEQAFPLLVQMAEEGYLVKNVATDEKSTRLKLPVDSFFLRYRVKMVCQEMEETAVYRVEDENSIPYALKLFAQNEESFRAYENEVSVLTQLDGSVNPGLVDHGMHADVWYLLTEWLDGMPVEKLACRYRNFTVKSNVLSLLDLCINVVEAYWRLHQQGILHGDIHPNNVLVDEKNSVKIIDYGYAKSSKDCQRTIRGGVEIHYEPELAKALLAKTPPPPATEKSEQFAIAVMLYQMLAGTDYLQLSFDPEKAFEQIVQEAPLPFDQHDLLLPPVVDEVFSKAFSKVPLDRYSSLNHFLEGLAHCRHAIAQSRCFFVPQKKNTQQQFVLFLLDKYSWDSALLKNGLQKPPTASVNNGAAGIAYFFYRAGCVYENPELLNLADAWIHRAKADAQNFDRAFYTTDGELSGETIGGCSIFHSPTGVHLVQALISGSRGNHFGLQKSINDFLAAAANPCPLLDLSLGKAGLLLAAAHMLKEAKLAPAVESEKLEKFGAATMQEIWELLNQVASIHEKSPVDCFGIAHGWAGILYASLYWCSISGHCLPATFHNKMESLLEVGVPNGKTFHWPFSADNSTSWPGWCHGSAGHILFWCLAYQYFNEKKFLVVAENTASALLQNKQTLAQLCCGLAGGGYAFSRLHQLTEKKIYRQKLQSLQNEIMKGLASPGIRPNSLYRGEIGIGVLLCELSKPSLAKMPLFE